MIVDCISDLHGEFPELQPGGDLLIIAGDCTSNDSIPAWHDFFDWIDRQTHRKKVMIAGNHDNFCKQWKICGEDRELDNFLDALAGAPTISYLCDSGIEFEGLKIWGSPWTTTFPGINPKCCAFTKATDEELAEKWALIPDDVNILITHSPQYGILDRNARGKQCGSASLCKKAITLEKLKLHVVGHIHEGYGETTLYNSYEIPYCYLNASHMDENYDPVNMPIRTLIL